MSLNGHSLENSQARVEPSLRSLISHPENGDQNTQSGCKFSEFVSHLQFARLGFENACELSLVFAWPPPVHPYGKYL